MLVNRNMELINENNHVKERVSIWKEKAEREASTKQDKYMNCLRRKTQHDIWLWLNVESKVECKNQYIINMFALSAQKHNLLSGKYKLDLIVNTKKWSMFEVMSLQISLLWFLPIVYKFWNNTHYLINVYNCWQLKIKRNT